MSLVAYGSSDESEDEIVSLHPSKINVPKHEADAGSKKRREGVKITIPALKEFEDEESPVVPKKPKLQSGSGLFSLLPPPKNTSTLSKPGFVPYVLSKKESPFPIPPKRETKPAEIVTDLQPEAPGSKLEEQDFDDETDETSHSCEKSKEDSHTAVTFDFFSLDKLDSKNKLDGTTLPSVFSKTDSSKDVIESNSFIQSGLSIQSPSASSSDCQQPLFNESSDNSYHQQYLYRTGTANDNREQAAYQQLDSYKNYNLEPVTEHNSKDLLLKDKEFLKLQGRHREFEAVDIIDVKADDQLTDRNEWLMKSITEESAHRPSRKKHNMPTQQQKRKHQITYLAFQAKEREMDLKNQWAMNSRTRRETQAKYGF